MPPEGHFSLNRLSVPQLQVDTERGSTKLEDSAWRYKQRSGSYPATPEEPNRRNQLQLLTLVPLFTFWWEAKFKRFKLESLSVGLTCKQDFLVPDESHEVTSYLLFFCLSARSTKQTCRLGLIPGSRHPSLQTEAKVCLASDSDLNCTSTFNEWLDRLQPFWGLYVALRAWLHVDRWWKLIKDLKFVLGCKFTSRRSEFRRRCWQFNNKGNFSTWTVFHQRWWRLTTRVPSVLNDRNVCEDDIEEEEEEWLSCFSVSLLSVSNNDVDLLLSSVCLVLIPDQNHLLRTTCHCRRHFSSTESPAHSLLWLFLSKHLSPVTPSLTSADLFCRCLRCLTAVNGCNLRSVVMQMCHRTFSKVIIDL